MSSWTRNFLIKYLASFNYQKFLILSGKDQSEIENEIIEKSDKKLEFIKTSMKKIDEEGKGVILLLSHSESSDELLSNISFLKGRKPKTKNDSPDTRIIGVGAQILKDLGVTKIRLLGASLKYPLTGFDLEITEFIN